jgi:hypothetical protein
MVNSIRPLSADSEPHGCTFQNADRRWDISVHTLKRAASYGMITTIQFGDRSIIPPAEVARIDRDGLGPIPTGYKRKTQGVWTGGRTKAAGAAADQAQPSKAPPSKTSPVKTVKPAKTMKAAGKVAPRRRRSEERPGAT